MGRPSSRIGITGLSTGSERWVTMIASTPALKPRNWLPESPMKSRAGWVLKRRKPKVAPITAMLRVTTGRSPGLIGQHGQAPDGEQADPAR